MHRWLGRGKIEMSYATVLLNTTFPFTLLKENHRVYRQLAEQVVERVHEHDYGFRSLIHEIIQSPIFLNQ